MHHQLDTKYGSSHMKRESTNFRIVTRIKQSQTPKATNTQHIKDKLKFRRRSYSNSISKYHQDSNHAEAYQGSNDDPNEYFKEKQNVHFDSSSISQSTSKLNHPKQRTIDLNNIYESRKNEVDFRKFLSNFQLDVLQLEALYYWLSNFGFHRSAPLQIPPYLSYYIYSLILYRSDIKEILPQYQDMLKRDNYSKFLRSLEGQYLQSKLQKQSLSYIYFYSIPDWGYNMEFLIFRYLDDIIHKLKLDYEILLNDFLMYCQLSNLQKDGIEYSLQYEDLNRKNNIAFGNIRFVFKLTDGQLIDFKQPIGKFEIRQFCDYIQFQNQFGPYIQQSELINLFKDHPTEPHSERVLILFLLADIELEQTIFQNLDEDLKNQQKKDIIQNLTSIYLEITTENRVCDRCVSMFQYIPVEIICQKFTEYFGKSINQKFQFNIISQYLVDPQVEMKYEKFQRIWVRIPQNQQHQQQQNLQIQQIQDFQEDLYQNCDIFEENQQEDLEIQEQKEIQREQKGQKDLLSVQKEEVSNKDQCQSLQQEEINQQEFLICYEEQEHTGLVSVLLLKLIRVQLLDFFRRLYQIYQCQIY